MTWDNGLRFTITWNSNPNVMNLTASSYKSINRLLYYIRSENDTIKTVHCLIRGIYKLNKRPSVDIQTDSAPHVGFGGYENNLAKWDYSESETLGKRCNLDSKSLEYLTISLWKKR